MSDAARFAHASEAELARILDYYEVRWEYEPRAFPIRWNLAGAVIESFAPDFFLPDLDLYVELTTLKQSLVRRKNRKLRRLRELYPMLRVKLLYGKDFRALLLKYGRIDVAASMIGLEGQALAEASGSGSDAPPVRVGSLGPRRRRHSAASDTTTINKAAGQKRAASQAVPGDLAPGTFPGPR